METQLVKILGVMDELALRGFSGTVLKSIQEQAYIGVTPMIDVLCNVHEDRLSLKVIQRVSVGKDRFAPVPRRFTWHEGLGPVTFDRVVRDLRVAMGMTAFLPDTNLFQGEEQ